MCARSYLPAHFLQPRELPSLHHPRTQVGQHTSPGILTSQLAILCLGRSYFHFSVPDFNILSENFLRHFGFLWKASSKLLFSPRKLHFPRCKFQSETLVHEELLPAIFLGSKHQILPCISPLQEPGLYPLSSTLHTFPSCLAASLPVASHILPNRLVPPGVVGNEKKLVAADLPLLGTAHAVIWFCSSHFLHPPGRFWRL